MLASYPHQKGSQSWSQKQEESRHVSNAGGKLVRKVSRGRPQCALKERGRVSEHANWEDVSPFKRMLGVENEVRREKLQEEFLLAQEANRRKGGSAGMLNIVLVSASSIFYRKENLKT